MANAKLSSLAAAALAVFIGGVNQAPPETAAAPPLKPIVIGKACMGEEAIWLNPSIIQSVTVGLEGETGIRVTTNFLQSPGLSHQTTSVGYVRDWESEKAAKAALAACEKDLRAAR